MSSPDQPPPDDAAEPHGAQSHQEPHGAEPHHEPDGEPHDGGRPDEPGATWDEYAELASYPPEPGPLRQAGVAVALALVIGGLGFAVGWFWYTFAPNIPIVKVDGGFMYADTEPEQPIAAEGWFIFTGIALGVIVAVAAYFLLRRYRGVPMLVALVVGSLLGAWAAWWLGHKLSLDSFRATSADAPVGAQLNAPIGLRITNMDPRRWYFPGLTGSVVAQALAAAVAYTAMAGFSAYENLRGPMGVERRQLSTMDS